MSAWERTAQDTAEAEHPPPKVPQEDPRLRIWSARKFATVVVVAFALLIALFSITSAIFDYEISFL